MKTLKNFIIYTIALIFLFACEPEEEIVPDIQVKENITTINLEVITVQSAIGGLPSIELSWESGLQNQAGFVVERSPNDSTHWQEIARLDKQATSFSDIDLPQDASGFYYRIKAIEQGDKPNAFKIFIPVFIPYAFIAPPSELTVTASSATVVELSWRDNSNNERGFIIERSLNGNTWSELNSVRTGTTTYQDQGLQANTKYFYRVLAFADNPRDRNNPNKSATSDAVEVTTPWRQCLESGTSHSKSFVFTQSCELTNVSIVGNITIINGTLRLTNSFVKGNITQHGDGDVIIKRNSEVPGFISQITGNVKEFGNGSIIVEESSVIGNLEESDTGGILIKENSKIGNLDYNIANTTFVVNEIGIGDITIDNSNVDAHVGEKNDGSIFIGNDSDVMGDIGEQEEGDVILTGSTISADRIGEQSSGNIKIEGCSIYGNNTYDLLDYYSSHATSIAEEGSGHVTISSSRVKGNVAENGYGHIDIKNNSEIGNRNFPGNVNEKDGGHVYLRDNSIIRGNLSESGYGTIYLDRPSNVKGNYAFD